MSNQAQRDDNLLRLVAPAGGVVGGTPIRIGNLFVIPESSVAAGEEFAGYRCAHRYLPKTTGQAWAVGDDLYWNASTSKFTNVAAADLLRCGRCTQAALTDDTSGWVLYDGLAAVSGFIAYEKATATAAPVYGAVVWSVQTGNGSLVIDGSTATRAGSVQVEITTQGAVGVAQFKWRIGDESWTTGVATAADVALGATGIHAKFTDGLQGAGVDSFEVSDAASCALTLEATANGQIASVTVNRSTPTQVTDSLVIHNSRITSGRTVLVFPLPPAGTRTTGKPTQATEAVVDTAAHKVTVPLLNDSLSAENGTSVLTVMVV